MGGRDGRRGGGAFLPSSKVTRLSLVITYFEFMQWFVNGNRELERTYRAGKEKTIFLVSLGSPRPEYLYGCVLVVPAEYSRTEEGSNNTVY